jgi:hypothetical protein
VALIVISFGLLAFFMFRKSKATIKLGALALVMGGVMALAFVAMKESRREPPLPPKEKTDLNAGNPNCMVNGAVFNSDDNPATGLQEVKLAYVKADASPVQVATTDPLGKFSFNCSQIKPEVFPIHLRATIKNGQSVESEDQLAFGENPALNIYISLKALAQHYQKSKAILRLPSEVLFHDNKLTVVTPDQIKVRPGTRFPSTEIIVAPNQPFKNKFERPPGK